MPPDESTTVLAAPPRAGELASLRFDNASCANCRPIRRRARGVRQVHGALYSRVEPDAGRARRGWSRYSREVAALLGIEPRTCRARRAFAEVFGGNALLDGHAALRRQLRRAPVRPLGRAARRRPRDHARRDDQRRTASAGSCSSRAPARRRTRARADGRAVLRSSVREFLCSEAMHHLGVPTTRALCLVATGEEVVRDMFYDGHPRAEPGAIVCRVAPSFMRFGNFELPASRDDAPLLAQLVDFTHPPRFSGARDARRRGPKRARERCAPSGSRRCASAPRRWSRTGCASASCTA